MTNEPLYRSLLRRTLIALTLCLMAIVFCYYLVDRPVAYFVHAQQWSKIAVFPWLTYPPPWVQTFSPAVLALLLLRRTWKPWTTCQLAIFTACLSLIVADEFRTSLGDLCGRYWPETWRNDNPSLIGTGTYGFHPFESGDDTGSFPSGHSARIAGFLGVFWIAWPRWRWLYVVIAAPMLFALVAMDYHFVSDVIAGTALGAIVAAWSAMLAGIKSEATTSPAPIRSL